MKTLIIVDDFSGGAGNIAQLLALNLKEQGHKISILLTCKRSEPRYDLSGVEWQDVNLSNIGGNKLFRLPRMIREVEKVVKQLGSQLIISFINNNNTIACLSAMNKNIPIIVAERSNPLSISPRFPWNYLRRIAYKRADAVSVQFDIFREFDGGRFREKCFVTHNIIAQAASTKTTWSRSKVSFISLGRYHPIKRYELMIKLFAGICQDREDVELHILGENIVNAKLKALISKYNADGKIHLHGAIRNVHEELIKHDVYLMTSEQEGFPNALSEALAVGLPIIAMKCHEGITRLVKNNQNGYCVEEGNEKEFIKAMWKLADDASTRKEFGRASLEIAKAFAEDKIMKEWKECIQIAVANRNRR